MKTLVAKYDLLYLCILLTGLTGIVLLYCTQGIGLTNDSGFYVYAGCYDYMMEPTGKSLTVFPPIYPTLIAILHYCSGLSPLNAAAALNLMVYLVFSYGIWKSGREHFKTSLYKYLFYTITLLGIPILMDAYMLWSELLFLTLVWFCLRYFYSYLLKENNKDLVYFSIFFLLCFLTRYAVLGLLPALYLLLLFQFRKNKIKPYLITILFTAIIPLLVLVRNILTNESPYDPPKFSFTENASMHTEVFSHFILPISLPDWIGSLSITLLLILLSYSTWKDKQNPIRLLHLSVILSYTLFLIILNSFKSIDIPDERFYSVIYAEFFLVLFLSIEKLSTLTASLSQKLIAAALILWSVYPLARSYKNTLEYMEGGIGYQTEAWRNNTLIKKAKSINGQFISNNPIPLIVQGRIATTHTVSLQASKGALYMLWWNNDGLDYLPADKGEWTKYYNFEPIDSTAQGTLYLLNKK